ncbi:MAG: sensor histidine kinase [Flammeovirgaceae bacterium]
MKQYLQEKYLRFLGILVLALTISFFIKEEHEPSLKHVLISIGITFIMWEGGRSIIFRFRKVYPQIKDTNKRLLFTAITMLSYVVIINLMVKVVLSITGVGDPLTPYNLFKHFKTTFTATVIVGVFYESLYFFTRWKETIVEKESLKHQQVRSQFAALKNQISPHFLFNSLNTLVTLIAENQELAIDFTQKLSEVYRYILQNKEKEVVSLRKELQFTDSYIFLLKMRFDKNLQVDIQVDDQYLALYIAPLSLQMLIENAIKHNEVSTARPLSIHISIENEDTIVVKNKLQRKRVMEPSTKTGLENIRKRYHHLSDRSIEVITTTSNFMVTLPLLKITKEEPVLSESL